MKYIKKAIFALIFITLSITSISCTVTKKTDNTENTDNTNVNEPTIEYGVLRIENNHEVASNITFYIEIYIDNEYFAKLYYGDFKEKTVEVGYHTISGTWTRMSAYVKPATYDIDPDTVFVSTNGLTWSYN